MLLRCIFVLHFLHLAVVFCKRGAFYLEEAGQQTYISPADSHVADGLGDHILDILDLNDAPIMTSSKKKRDGRISTFMARLYQQIEEGDAETRSGISPKEMATELTAWSSADRIVSLSPLDISALATRGLFRVSFSLATLTSASPTSLNAAQLHVFVSHHVTVAKITVRSSEDASSAVFSSFLSPVENSLVMNVTGLVGQWISHTESPEMFIHIESAELSHVEHSLTDVFIVAAFQEDAPSFRRRNRRSSSSSPTPSTSTKNSKRKDPLRDAKPSPLGGCRKQGLYVSFADLGWKEWVIAPEGYMAFFCGGECSFPLHNRMNATNHAIVQTLAHLVHPSRADQAKCAPVRLAPMKILFIDNHQNVVMKRYRDMVVQECGCH